MKFKEIAENTSRIVSKLAFKTKKHSPEIFMVVGTVSIIAGTVKACKATIKMQSVLEETSDTIEQIHACANGEATLKEGATYTEEDERKDLTTVYIQTAVKTVKLYAPAIILIGGGLGCMYGSHYIMRKRYSAAVAAYTAVNNAFNEYRNRVRDAVGENVEQGIYSGVKAVESEELDENGNPKEETVADTNASPYALLLNENVSKNWKNDPDYNRMWIISAQTAANLKLKRRGYIFLNEVYELLGARPTKIGQFAGWIYDKKNPNIDSCVDFGLYDGDHVDYGELFSNGIWLDFNCDGNIIDKI